jgi:AcrR family transcriptional regulator
MAGSSGQRGSRSSRREQELVATALELFSEMGYQETSIQELADALGITRSLFYYYFRSKEELLWRIIGHLGDELLEAIRPIATGPGSAAERFRQVVETHIGILLANLDAYRVYFAELNLVADRREQQLRQRSDEYHDLVSALVAEGQATGEFREGDPLTLVRLLMGMAYSVTDWYSGEGEDIGRVAADCMIAALGNFDTSVKPA